MAHASRYTFVVLLSLIPVVSFGATDTLLKSAGLGTHSFLLGIDGLLDLSDFFYGAISYKYQYTPVTAFRLGVSFSANQRKDTIYNRYASSSSADAASTLYGSGGLRLQCLRYPRPLAAIKLFYGAGPYIQADYSKQVTTRTGNYPSEKIDKRDTGISLGISVPLGLEWLFTQKFGLVVEYGASVSYYWDRISTYYNDRLPGMQNDQGWRLDTKSIRLGLSI